MTPAPLITADDFGTIGRAVFGDRWKNAMARALDTDLRTIGKWAKKGAPISIREDLLELLQGRAILIAGAASRLIVYEPFTESASQ
jgi:hypothetical protein